MQYPSIDPAVSHYSSHSSPVGDIFLFLVQMAEDLQGADKEDMRHVVEETEQLLMHCSKKYDQEQYRSALLTYCLL